MTKLVGFLTVFLCASCWALAPVEGLLLGEVDADLQSDPLNFIFSNDYDQSQFGENRKVKVYHSTYHRGQELHESCGYLGAITYATPWQETQARRTIVATLQYLGLDMAVKAIGTYAKDLQVSEAEYRQLATNLVRNYCSKNITVYSLRLLEESLKHYYANPVPASMPSVATSPFASAAVKNKTQTPEARSREFEQVIKNFRALCSWGGDVDDYRMLAPYLSNRYIMAFVMNNLAGISYQLPDASREVRRVWDDRTVQVACTDLICRRESPQAFQRIFPLSLGSTGVATDVAKQYCQHFRMQGYSNLRTLPEVKGWVKAQELESPIFETSMFLSLLTGVPDLVFGADAYQDIPLLVKSSIDDRWNRWAKVVLETFSRSLFYEESLKVRVDPRTDRLSLRTDGFGVNVNVTLGELDRLLRDTDKLKLSFDLDLSKNFFRSLRTRWTALAREVDTDGQEALKKEIAAFVELQLQQKRRYFTQSIWNENFSYLIAEELISQALRYEGPLFESYADRMLKVPIKFSYGLFALSYLRNRTDLSSGKFKLNL